MSKISKAKSFAKKHWKGLAIAGATVGVGTVAAHLLGFEKGLNAGVRAFGNELRKLYPKTLKKMSVPDSLKKFGVDSIITDPDGTLLEVSTDINYKATVSDLGEFGKALCDIPNVSENDGVWILASIQREES